MKIELSIIEILGHHRSATLGVSGLLWKCQNFRGGGRSFPDRSALRRRHDGVGSDRFFTYTSLAQRRPGQNGKIAASLMSE